MRHRTIRGMAALGLVVASCGGGSDEDATPADTVAGADGASDPGDRAPDDQPASTEQDGNENQQQDVLNDVDGPPWGPDDPIVPGRYGALHPVSTGSLDCATAAAEGEGEFWQFVGAACQAALGQGPWPAGPIPNPPPTDNPYTACLDGDVIAWLQRLQTHFSTRSDPPRLVVPDQRPADSCRTRIFVFDVGAFGDGVQVRLAMELPFDAGEEVLPEVRVDGAPADVVDTAGTFETPQLFGTTYFIAGPFEEDTVTIEGTNLLGSSTVTIELPPGASGLSTDGEGAPGESDPDGEASTVDTDDGGQSADDGAAVGEGDDGG